MNSKYAGREPRNRQAIIYLSTDPEEQQNKTEKCSYGMDCPQKCK